MLQNGHDENLKKVKITLLPFVDDISNMVPSIAGNEILGASSPISNRGIEQRYELGVKTILTRILKI